MDLEEQVTQAVARGWCHPDNSDKVMDVDLAKAIAAEVVKSFSPAPPENNVRAMPDDVGVTDAALVELVARAMCQWASGRNDLWRSWEGEADAAIAAMQPALDAAREAGRREGYEDGQIEMQGRAAEACDRLSYTPAASASTRAAMCARQIRAFSLRALIPATPGLM